MVLDPYLFNNAFGGGLRTGSALGELFQNRRERKQLSALGELFRQGRYEDVGANLVGMGKVGEGVNVAQIPYKQEQQRLQQEFQNAQFQALNQHRQAQFDWQRAEAERDNAFRQSEADWRRSQAETNARYSRIPAGYGSTNPEDPNAPLVPLQGGPADPATIQAVNEAKNAGKPVKLSKGREALDREFAKEYADWKARGGYSDAMKQVQQLEEAANMLESGDGNLTGRLVGRLPDVLRSESSISTRDVVEEVVQRNLRLILGAQFTQKEGERLIARAYNETLPEAENLKRVRRLIQQIKTAAYAKESASRYFEMNGTLDGWTGKTYTMQDFENALEDGPQQTVTVIPDKDQSRVSSDDINDLVNQYAD